MYQIRRIGLNHSESLPWLGVYLKTSSPNSFLVFLHSQQYFYLPNNQYCQSGGRGFVDEK